MIARSRALTRCAGVGAPVVVAVLLVGGGFALGSQRTITRSNARAVATAINLRAGDLPDLKAEPAKPESAQGKRLIAQSVKCLGLAPPSEDLAEVESASFAHSTASTSLSVSSDTSILPSASVVANDLAAERLPHALTCDQVDVGGLVRPSLPHDVTATIEAARLPVALSGTDGVNAVRVTVVLRTKQGPATVSGEIYIDVVGFAYGQAEVTLNIESAFALPSSSLETRLLTLLVERARAAIG
jgi:hypothetical protein